MTVILGKLCCTLLLEHFGSIVQSVADDLFRHGYRTIYLIRLTTKLPCTKIKEALCVLIKFGFVRYQVTEGIIRYSLEVDRVLEILYYPRYMYLVKSTSCDESELLFEEVLKNGYLSASTVIINVVKKLAKSPSDFQTSVKALKEKFELLVKNQYLMRYIDNEDENIERFDFSLPNLDEKSIILILESKDATCNDEKIYWKVNFDRFNQDMRDQIIVQAVTKRFDGAAGELMRQLLILMYLRTASWADSSNPIPFTEIRDAVKKLNFPILTQYLDQYLRLIEEDSCKFLQKVGFSGGGQYSVKMKDAFYELACTTIDNIVLERFGSKAARIFRLVRNKKHIEQEQIKQFAMIPDKEAKHLTYTLLKENYIQMQELKKVGIATAPTKTFFLFHMDVNKVIHMEIEHCYHALYNILQRREHESTSNRRLIDKELRMQTIISNLKEQGTSEEELAEIEGMMTPSETLHLQKIKGFIKKLGLSELYVNETLFLLTMYSRYFK